jgi:hypothetical protein
LAAQGEHTSEFQSDLFENRMSMSSTETTGNAREGAVNSESMSLPDRIYDLCQRGMLPAQFRVNDVRQVLGDTYAETYIRRALGLYSEKPGNYTYRWNKPRFRKVRHGVYELVS